MTLSMALRRSLTAVGVAMLALPASAAAAIPLPRVIGPLRTTARSYPFGSATHQRQPQNLRRFGFREDEYLVHGRANVYDWPSAARGAVVRTPNAPYTTRMLIRRPADPRRASGTVWVEMLNPSNHFDLNLAWALAQREFVHSDDAWVGITAKPIALQALKTFEPRRYRALSFKNPLSLNDPRNCTTLQSLNPGDSSRQTENGLVWDAYSQVAAWIRSRARSNPFRSEHDRLRVYGFGYSQTGGYLATYIGALHRRMTRLSHGHPLFDGYVIGGAGGAFAGLAPINQCAPVPPVGDPRYRIHDLGVPVIRVMTQSDYLFGIAARRPDSNRRIDRYRSYDLAGAPHATVAELRYSASPLDIKRAGRPLPASRCDQGPRSPFPSSIYFDAVLRNLDLWVRHGVAPPPGRHIEVRHHSGVLDRFGNVVGGVRSPFVDVPTSTWLASQTGPVFCYLVGLQRPFSQARLRQLYPTHHAYVIDVTRDVRRLERQRYLTPYDGASLITHAQAASVP